MFEVKELGLIVKFQKGSVVHPRLQEARYVTWCYIKIADDIYSSCTAAMLNPCDRNDKIVGKKIVLQKAMKQHNFDKYQRTLIWNAFWTWVSSWKKESVV